MRFIVKAAEAAGQVGGFDVTSAGQNLVAGDFSHGHTWIA